MFINTILKDSKKLKELEIMYQNANYICLSWFSKICWFPVKKCSCRQNARGVSRDSYIFCIFSRYITLPSFIIVGYVWQILRRGPFCHRHRWAARKGPFSIRLRPIYGFKLWFSTLHDNFAAQKMKFSVNKWTIF